MTRLNAQEGTYILNSGRRLCREDVVTVEDIQEILAYHLRRVEPPRGQGRPGSEVPVGAQIPKFVPVWDVAFARWSPPGEPADAGPVPSGVAHTAIHAWALAVIPADWGPPCGAPKLPSIWVLRGGPSPSGIEFSPDGTAVFGASQGPGMAVLDASARLPARRVPLAEADGSSVLWDGLGGFSTARGPSPRGAYFVVARRAGVR